MSDDLDAVLDAIDELEVEAEDDTYPWADAAVWSTNQRRMPDPIGDPFDDRFWRTAQDDPDFDHYGHRDAYGLCAGDPVVLALTARDGSTLVSWDMDTCTWTGIPDVVRTVQTAVERISDTDMAEFEQVGQVMMSLADDLDAAPNTAVYVSVTPR